MGREGVKVSTEQQTKVIQQNGTYKKCYHVYTINKGTKDILEITTMNCEIGTVVHFASKVGDYASVCSCMAMSDMFNTQNA